MISFEIEYLNHEGVLQKDSVRVIRRTITKDLLPVMKTKWMIVNDDGEISSRNDEDQNSYRKNPEEPGSKTHNGIINF